MNDLADWPVLVLTAGLATRLRPLSDVRAKAAMPVAGQSIIGRILHWLRAAGVRRVVLNLHHRPETITRLVGDGSEWGLEVRYSWERVVLGSAGGARRAIPLLEAERFLIVNGDTLTSCDLRAVARHHMETGALVSMAVVGGDVGRYGGVVVANGDEVVGFVRADRAPSADSSQPALPGPPGLPAVRAFHFIGVQAVQANAFAEVADDEPSETVQTLYPRLIGKRPGAITAFTSDAEFLDIGTPADYLATVATVAAREGCQFDRGEDSTIDSGAIVRGTVLWDRVSVARDAELISCVVADGVRVPAGARYERSAIVAGAGGLVVRSF